MSTNTLGEAGRIKVASKWHTVVLLLALAVVSAHAAVSGRMEEWPRTLSEPGARSRLYVQILVLQWVWAAYVWFGIRRAGGGLRGLVDEAAWTAKRWLKYAAVGLGGAVLWSGVGAGLGAVLPASTEQLRGVAAMLPHTSGERLLWLGFALSAGICEEIVYRGYLLRQFSTLAGGRPVAVLLQALIYGAAHLALPLEMVVSVVMLGVFLGAVAAWQKSLVPSMIIHSATGLMALMGSLASR